ncbi:TetR/AcrR family transcriptional regulator C-terminal domain-containing protein [Saccharopolyspora sp. NPDC002578]
MAPGTSPPYRAIAAEIRKRIESGELGPGDRVPSIRHLARRWGVAVATATKAAAVLREEGLVEPRSGSGTVVSARPRRQPSSPAPGPGADEPPEKRERLLDAAIAIADAEGLDAVSMRRLAAHLGVGPMSLYRSVAGKDELLFRMADRAFGEIVLPAHGPPGWRAKLEHIAREGRRLFRRHPWLPRVVSFTRPTFAPHMMAHTEWTLRALDGLGLPMETRVREALTLHAFVLSAAASAADETDAEQSTGVPLENWRAAHRPRARRMVGGDRFPLLAAMPEAVVDDVDALFEYGLARHLDGFAQLIERHQR